MMIATLAKGGDPAYEWL